MNKAEVTKWLAEHVNHSESRSFAKRTPVLIHPDDLMALLDHAVERVAMKYGPKPAVLNEADMATALEALRQLDSVLKRKHQVAK